MNQWLQQGLIFSIAFSGVIAVAQVPKQAPSINPISPNNLTPNSLEQPSARRLKITITINSLDDLKVTEGDKVSKNQTLADRERERSNLEREKRQVLLAIAKIEQSPPPTLKTAPPITDLPSISFAEQEATAQQAELKFTQAQRNYNNALTLDPFITVKASVDFAKAAAEQAYRNVELQQRKLDTVNGLKNLPPEISIHETEKLKQKQTEWEKAKADYDLKVAEFEQVKGVRAQSLAELTNKVEEARAELELTQAKYRTAKEARRRDEYEHQITVARRAEEANQAAIALSQQNLEREFKLSQLKEQKSLIDEKINQIAIVKSPYDGIIKRIKTERQTDNNIIVELSLVTDTNNNGGAIISPEN